MWSSERNLLASLRRQMRTLIGRGEIPYVVELGWQPFGVLYRAQKRRSDDALPRSVLNLPLRLVADEDTVRVTSYRTEQRGA
jgi:hypothetical protein